MSVNEQNQQIQDLLVKYFVSGNSAQKELANKIAGVMLNHIPKAVAWRYRFVDYEEGPGIWQVTNHEAHVRVLAQSKHCEIQELYA